ncbi:hypothetical protein Syun_016958 [Stephania yunnanensis]|uniref:Transposase n=1 Tax=Stephania yunnanensis TaxID=152371 RepID=A0AAP0J8B8_9MAGN
MWHVCRPPLFVAAWKPSSSAFHPLALACATVTAVRRCQALMHKLKKNRVHPNFVTDEAWRRYLEYWESEDFLARSRKTSINRNTEVEGPGTGPSKHGGGSVFFVTTNERLTNTYSKFDSVAEQLQQAVALMPRQFGMIIDGADISQPQPPPPPHKQQHQPPQIDPADPPQQQDNVDRDTQDWLTRDEQLGDT